MNDSTNKNNKSSAVIVPNTHLRGVARPINQWILLSTVLICGVGLTLGMVLSIKKAAHDHRISEFQDVSQVSSVLLENQIKTDTSTAQAGSFMWSSTAVTRASFSNQAKKITQLNANTTSLSTMVYLPRVTSESQRLQLEQETSDYFNQTIVFKESAPNGTIIPRSNQSLYYPILYTEPAYLSTAIYLYDFYVVPLVKSMIDEAFTTEAPVSSPGFMSSTETGELTPSILYLIPVLPQGDMVMAVMNTATILFNAVSELQPVPGVQFTLKEENSDLILGKVVYQGGIFVVQIDTQNRNGTKYVPQDNVLRHVSKLSVGQVPWEFIVEAGSEFYPVEVTSYIGPVIGVVVLYVTCAILGVVIIRREAEHAIRIQRVSMEKQKSLLDFVCHQLRNPANASVNLLHLMDPSPLSPSDQELFHQLTNMSSRFVRLLDYLLDDQRLLAPRNQDTFDNVEIYSVIRDEIAFHNIALGNRGSIEIHANPKLCSVRCVTDEMILRQIVYCAIISQMQYSRPGATIRVHMDYDNNRSNTVSIYFSVENHNRVSLSKPHESLDLDSWARSVSAMCWDEVANLGRQIGVVVTTSDEATILTLKTNDTPRVNVVPEESVSVVHDDTELSSFRLSSGHPSESGSDTMDQDNGSDHIIVMIPDDDMDNHAILTSPDSSDTSTQSSPKCYSDSTVYGPPPRPLENVKVVLADDERVNRMVLRRILCGLGFRDENIVEYDDGEPIKLAIEDGTFTPPDIVLMDIVMKRCHGTEVAASLRTNYPDLPIIAVTANASSYDIGRYKMIGFEAVVQKPINKMELMSKMMNLLKPV